MHIRRHHLIEEAKAELDVTYEEVKRAENRLIALDLDYGCRAAQACEAGGGMPDRIAALFAERDERKLRVDLASLYGLEKAALERFAILTAAFSSVCMHPDDDEAVRRIGDHVFRPAELDSLSDGVRRSIRDFVRGLRAYTTQAASSQNDRIVREAWTEIEKALRAFGRRI